MQLTSPSAKDVEQALLVGGGICDGIGLSAYGDRLQDGQGEEKAQAGQDSNSSHGH